MKEFFKYVLATIVGFLAISLIGIFLMFIVVLGQLSPRADKEVTVTDQSNVGNRLK